MAAKTIVPNSPFGGPQVDVREQNEDAKLSTSNGDGDSDGDETVTT